MQENNQEQQGQQPTETNSPLPENNTHQEQSQENPNIPEATQQAEAPLGERETKAMELNDFNVAVEGGHDWFLTKENFKFIPETTLLFGSYLAKNNAIKAVALSSQNEKDPEAKIALARLAETMKRENVETLKEKTKTLNLVPKEEIKQDSRPAPGQYL